MPEVSRLVTRVVADDSEHARVFQRAEARQTAFAQSGVAAARALNASMTQAFRSIASEAEAAATRATRALQTLSRIRLTINTQGSTRALAGLEQAAQKSQRAIQGVASGTVGRLNVTPALNDLRLLAAGATSTRGSVQQSLTGIRPQIVTAPFTRSLQGLSTASAAVSRALKADLGTFTPKLAAEGLVRPLADVERRSDALGLSLRRIVPQRVPVLPVAANVTALGRLATAAGRMANALDRAFLVTVPRLDVRGLEVPLRSASTAAQRAGAVIREALANLRVTLDASPIIAPLRRVEAASRASAAVVKAQFSNLRIVIAESPAIAALARVRQAVTQSATTVRDRLAGLRIQIDIAPTLAGLATLQRRAIVVGRAAALALGLLAPKIDLRAILAPLAQLGERAGQAARRVKQAFEALRPTLDLRAGQAALVNLQQRAQGVARSIRGALSGLRVSIDTSNVARAVTATVRRSQEGAREVARAFASLRPEVDLSSLARLPALTARIRTAFQQIVPRLDLRSLSQSFATITTQAQTAARTVGAAMVRLASSLSGRVAGRPTLDLSGVTAPLASIGSLATRAAQTVQRTLGSLRPQIDVGGVTGALTRLRGAAETAGTAARAALGRLSPKLDVQGFTTTLRVLVDQARGAGQRIAASLAGAKVSVDLSPLTRLVAAGRQASAAFRALRLDFDTRGALASVQTLQRSAATVAASVARSFASLRARLDTTPATRALTALGTAAQATVTGLRQRLAGIAISIDTGGAVRALTGLGGAAQSVAARVRSGLAGLRATLDASGATRTLGTLGQQAVAAGQRIRSAVSGIVAKVDTRDLSKLPLIALGIGSAFAALHPHLDTAGLIEPLSRVQLLATSAATLVGAVWQRVKPRLEASGILEPLKRIPQAALAAVRTAATALGSLRPTVNVSNVVAGLGRIAGVAQNAATGLQGAFQRVRLAVPTAPLLSALQVLGDVAQSAGQRTRAAFTSIGAALAASTRTAAQAASRIGGTFAALRPRLDVAGITSALASLPATAAAVAGRVTAAFSGLRANLNTSPFAQGLARVSAAVTATVQRVRVSLGNLPVNVVTTAAETALSGFAARAREAAARVGAAFAGLRPQVDTSGLERVPGLTQRISASLNSLRERFQALRGGLTVPTAVDQRGLTTGIQAATIKVANFHPTATGRLDIDAKPLNNGITAAGQKLSAFERQFEKTAQKLALLKAPDLGTRLQIQFPQATGEQIARLAQMEKEIQGIGNAAKSTRPSLTGMTEAIQGLLSGGALGGLGAVFASQVTRPVLGMIGSFDSAAVKVDSLQRALIAVMGDSRAAGAEFEKLRESAKLPGLGFVEAIEGSVRLQNAGLSAEQARKLLEGFGKAISLAGGGKDDLAEVARQLQQIATKGKVLMADIRPILDRAPILQKVLKDAFAGFTDTSQLEKAGVTTKEFFAILTQGLGSVQGVTDSARNQIDNFTDAVFQARARIGKALLPLQARLFETLTPLIEKAVRAFTNLPEPVQQGTFAVTAFTAVLIPLGFGIAGATIALKTLGGALFTTTATAGATTLAIEGAGAAIGAFEIVATGGLAAVGIAIAAYLTNLGGFRDKTNEAFRVLGAMFTTYAESWKMLGRGVLETFRGEWLKGARDVADALMTENERMQARIEKARAGLSANKGGFGFGGRGATAGGSVTPEQDAKNRALLEQRSQAQGAADAVQKIDLAARIAANKSKEAFSKAIEEVQKELSLLNAPTLAARIKIEIPGISDAQARTLALYRLELERQKTAVDQTRQALETLSSGLRDFAKDLLQSAGQLPQGALRRETEARARQLQTRSAGVAQQAQFPAGAGGAGGANYQGILSQQFNIQQQAISQLGERFGVRGCALAVSSILSGSVQALGNLKEASVSGLVKRLTGLGARVIAPGQQQPGDVGIIERQGKRSGHTGVVAEREGQLGLIHNSTAAGHRLAFDSGVMKQASFFLRLQTKDTGALIKATQAGVPVIKAFNAEETALADPALRAREVFQSLSQRFLSARRELALLSATTAEGKVNVDLLGREFAKSDPLLVHWAQATAAIEEALRRAQLEKQIQGIGRNARQEFLLAKAGTDAERIALEQLGLTLQTLPQSWQAVIERSAEFSRQAKAITAVADAQREFLASVAQTRTAELAITEFRMAFEQLSPAIQNSLKERAAWEQATARAQNVRDATAAIADMRLETAKATATNELQRRGLDLLRQPLDDYAAGLRALGGDLAEHLKQQQAAAKQAPAIAAAMVQGAASFVTGGALAGGARIAETVAASLANIGQAGRGAVGSLLDVGKALLAGRFPAASQALGMAAEGISAARVAARGALPDIAGLSEGLASLGDALAAGSETRAFAALGQLRPILQTLSATVGEADPRFKELAQAIKQVESVLTAAAEAPILAFAQGMQSVSAGAKKAAEDLARFNDTSAIEQRTAQVTAQAMLGLSTAFLKGGGDVDQFVQKALAGDKTLQALRQSAALSDVAFENFGKSFEDVVADAFENFDLDTVINAFIPWLESIARQKVAIEDRADASKLLIGVFQREAEVTKRLKDAIAETTAGQGIATSGAELYRYALERLNLTTTALTEEQKRLAVEFGEKAFRAEITGRVTAARNAMEAATGAASKQTQILRELNIEFGNLSQSEQKFATENVNKILRFEAIAQFADGVKNVFQTAFTDLYQNGFRGFFNSVVSGFNQMLVKLAADYLSSQIATLVSNAFGLGGGGGKKGGGLGNAIGSLLGGLFGGTRALGGPVTAGRAYLVGEHQPEVFIPRQSGTVAPMQAVAAGGQAAPINVYVNVTATDVSSFRRSQGQIAGEVARSLQVISRREGR